MQDSKQYYLINTNTQAGEEDERKMLEKKEAAAFFNPYKQRIGNLKRGDCVFLYRSKVGIIAGGTATGKLIKRAYRNNPEFQEEDWSMSLDSFQLLKEPIAAKEIKRIAGRNMVFIQTFIRLPEPLGQQLWNSFFEKKIN